MSKYWIPFTKQMGNSEKDYYNHIMKGIDEQLRLTSEWLSSEEAKNLQYNNRTQLKNALNKSELNKNIDLLRYSDAQNSKEYIQYFYEQGAMKGCKDIKQELAFTEADKEALWHLYDYNYRLITDVSSKFKDQLYESLTTGILEGSSISKIRNDLVNAKLEPINNISTEARARMIARTEYSRARVTGALQSYANYGVNTVEIITAGDDYVCDICLDAEEKNPYDLNDKFVEFPPFHPNCRCTVAPVTSLSEYQNSPALNPATVNLIPNQMGEYDRLLAMARGNPSEVARAYALEHFETDTHEVFVDRAYNTTLRVRKNFDWGYARDGIKYYVNAPKLMRKCVSEINLMNKTEDSHKGDAVGRAYADNQKVEIFSTAFSYTNRFAEGTFLHEMAHTVDTKLGQNKANENRDSSAYPHYSSQNSPYTSNYYKTYEQLVMKEGDATSYSASQKSYRSRIHEDFAEASQIVLNNNHKGEYRGVNDQEWMKKNPLKTKFIKEFYGVK